MAFIPERKYKRPVIKKSSNWLRDAEDKKFYDTAEWRKLSVAFKRTHPVCQVEGCTQSSYYTDHIKPISEGGDKLAWSNLQALCKSHNAIKTAKQKQGLNR